MCTTNDSSRERWKERERKARFLCTRSSIFNSRKLNSVHYIFMVLPIPSLPENLHIFAQLQQVALDVHISFISLPGKAFPAMCSGETWKCSVVFLFLRRCKFSCQNSVFIMLLLLEPAACSTPKHVICISRVEWRFFIFGMVNGKKSFHYVYDEKHKFYVLFDGSRLAVMQYSEIIW